MTTNRAIALVIVASFIILAAASATAPRYVEGADDGPNHRLPGSWLVDIIISPQVSFPALFTFTSDGALITTESLGPFESPGHGNWVRRGHDVAFTFLALIGSPQGAGQNTGSFKVVGTLSRDAHSDTWSGPFRIEQFNTVGEVLFTGTGQLQLTRIAVEALED